MPSAVRMFCVIGFAAGAGVVTTAATAQAATTTAECNSFGERTNFSGNQALRFGFDQFDPTLGELVDAELSVRLSVNWDDRVEINSNVAGNPYTITATRSVNSSIVMPGMAAPVTATSTASYVVTDIYSEGAIEEPIGTDAAGTDVPNDDGFRRIGSSSQTATNVAADDPTPYIGDGQVEVVVSAFGTSNFDGADNAAIFASTVAAGEVCVQYSYIPFVSVGDYVWLDVDRDGIQDSGEPPVGNVALQLSGGPGPVDTTTSAAGTYAFRNLLAGGDYEVEVVPPAGYSLTTRSAGGSNIANDSGFDVDTNRQAFVAPAGGSNLAAPPDDPTIDAGLVAYDLALTKELVTEPPFVADQQIVFRLVPSNLGPADALPGWSVTDLVPDGLTLVSMSGTGYDCAGATCTSGSVLPAGDTAPPIDVVVTLDEADSNIRNLAYVAPALDDVGEIIPLVVPAPGIDTTTTATNNDAHADVAGARYDLALLKTAERSQISAEELAVLTVAVRNQGNVPSGEIVVTDEIPAGTRADFISADGTYTESTRRITWTVADVAPGATVELIVALEIVDVDLESYVNTAEISADQSAAYNGDIDSTADADLANDVLVDQTSFPPDGFNDPTVDEDDHDIAEVVIDTTAQVPPAPPTPVPMLPATGASGLTGLLTAIAGMLVLAGFGALRLSRGHR